MHDNVQPAELIRGGFDGPCCPVRPFQVERQSYRRQTLLLNAIDHHLGSAQGAIGCCDLGAALGESSNNCRANGAPHSGHQCSSASESVLGHYKPPFDLSASLKSRGRDVLPGGTRVECFFHSKGKKRSCRTML